ncbi:hypothetical protein [Microbacterium sp. NIBRBAC000506063]|uniref:hypothetical protein n=1 Tax=Microbacterium sp. NIBRBAC000506063 TaxID=2734618 RepID=UPI001BB679EB|nr:hypothetical protein [Microbacterium sp. NIBRBAC000506063]QTV80569.1 hypothetical protein KAE78_06860 [Microbacterium sp. NIBRBAC000506063]
MNELELDRFAPELFVDGVCFLYGDTLYSDEAMRHILATPVGDLDFFGDERGIVAVRAGDAEVLRTHFDRVRRLYLAGEIAACKGGSSTSRMKDCRSTTSSSASGSKYSMS